MTAKTETPGLEEMLSDFRDIPQDGTAWYTIPKTCQAEGCEHRPKFVMASGSQTLMLCKRHLAKAIDAATPTLN